MLYLVRILNREGFRVKTVAAGEVQQVRKKSNDGKKKNGLLDFLRKLRRG